VGRCGAGEIPGETLGLYWRAGEGKEVEGGDDRWARMVSGTCSSRVGGCARVVSDTDMRAILVSG
jgi:hypothetical protein